MSFCDRSTNAGPKFTFITASFSFLLVGLDSERARVFARQPSLPAPTLAPDPAPVPGFPDGSAAYANQCRASSSFVQLVAQAVDCVNQHADINPLPTLPSGGVSIVVAGQGSDATPGYSGASAEGAQTINVDSNGDGTIDSSIIYVFEKALCDAIEQFAEATDGDADAMKASKDSLVAVIYHELSHIETPVEVVMAASGGLESPCVRLCSEMAACRDAAKALCNEVMASTGSTAVLCEMFKAQYCAAQAFLAQIVVLSVALGLDCDCSGFPSDPVQECEPCGAVVCPD